jgi:PPOX class probable F420-dependent enzyme
MSRTGADRLDEADPQAKTAIERLQDERAGWLTTVASDGTPQSSPIWFIWNDGDLYLYSRRSPRVANVRQNPRVSFNLDGNRMGGRVVVLEGTAIIDEQAPPVHENEQYLEKYGPVMAERDWSPEWFAENYPVFIRVLPTRFRYW